MELRHLRYFCAVAENRSFTLAARRLNVSQSGVSGQVRDLERELGVMLLYRNQREVWLTPEGTIFWEEAREILLRAERAIELTKKSSLGTAGKLMVGLCGPVTASFLPRLIRKFRRQSPAVTLALRERVPSEQVDALLNGQIDIGFTRSVSAEAKPLVNQIKLFREPVVVALPKDHPLAANAEVAPSALASNKLVLYYRDGAPEIFDGIVSMCKTARFSPKIGDTPPSWHSVLTMVEAGEGVSLVPTCVQHLHSNDVVFRPLQGKGIRLDAIVIWRRSETNVVVEKFLDLLRSDDVNPGGKKRRRPQTGAS